MKLRHFLVSERRPLKIGQEKDGSSPAELFHGPPEKHAVFRLLFFLVLVIVPAAVNGVDPPALVLLHELDRPELFGDEHAGH